MGSNTKHGKETRKRHRHSRSPEREPREKRHRHHRRHHKERRYDKPSKPEYESADSDVVEVSSDEGGQASSPVRSATPEVGTNKSVESLSIEETNKLRAKLGLKPLQFDDRASGSKTDSKNEKRKDDWGEFYHKPAQSLTEKNQQDKVKSKLADLKDKRKIHSKLQKQKLLSEKVESDDDDAAAWVKKNKKIVEAKKEAEKRAKMLEELDAQFGIGEVVESEMREKRNQKYNDKNLKGLQVGHDSEVFQEGKIVVLTLKDQAVLDDGDDVLVNVNLLDEERYQKSNENKKYKVGQNDFDEEEVDEIGMLKPKSMLKKYDEEIDGVKKDGFKIGYDNAAERKRIALERIKEKLSNKIVETIAPTELTIASDYYTEEEMAKFKKPKKRKVKKLRTKEKILTADDLENLDKNKADGEDVLPMETDIKFKVEDENEEALEKALRKAKKIKQRGYVLPAMVQNELKMESTDTMDPGNIILNATAEFCRTLGDIPTYGKSGNREDTENLLDFEKEVPEDMKCEEDEEVDLGGKWNAVDPNKKQERIVPVATEVQILDEEPDVGSGVGAALKLAMSKGYLEREEDGRPSNTRLAHLQAQHYSIEDKNYGEDLERGNRRERYSGPIMDFKEKDGFKPNVKLEYIDDEGHVLNAKEAFRYLSHKFHGKGPGKNKVEKRLKKAQQEGLMKKMSSTDTPLGTLHMLQSKQKETQSPFVVLSGGKQNNTSNPTISKSRR